DHRGGREPGRSRGRGSSGRLQTTKTATTTTTTPIAAYGSSFAGRPFTGGLPGPRLGVSLLAGSRRSGWRFDGAFRPRRSLTRAAPWGRMCFFRRVMRGASAAGARRTGVGRPAPGGPNGPAGVPRALHAVAAATELAAPAF